MNRVLTRFTTSREGLSHRQFLRARVFSSNRDAFDPRGYTCVRFTVAIRYGISVQIEGVNFSVTFSIHVDRCATPRTVSIRSRNRFFLVLRSDHDRRRDPRRYTTRDYEENAPYVVPFLDLDGHFYDISHVNPRLSFVNWHLGWVAARMWSSVTFLGYFSVVLL